MVALALPPLISSDGHLEVRPERWTPRMPAGYRERAPRTVKLPDGGDAILVVLDFFHLRDTPVGRTALAAMP